MDLNYQRGSFSKMEAAWQISTFIYLMFLFGPVASYFLKPSAKLGKKEMEKAIHVHRGTGGGTHPPENFQKVDLFIT